jgi:hypothetical protein
LSSLMYFTILHRYLLARCRKSRYILREMFVSRTLTSISYFPNFVSSRIQKDYSLPLQIHQYLAMFDNGHSLIVEGRTVTLTAPERSFKSISGMVELVRGIVPMGSAQTAEFE